MRDKKDILKKKKDEKKGKWKKKERLFIYHWMHALVWNAVLCEYTIL